MKAFVLLALVALLGNVQCQPDARDQTAEECVGKVMDIFFVLDSSTSIYVNDFRTEHQFVRDVVSRFDISDRNTRVGLLTFSDDYTRPVLGLNRFQTKSEILSSINERNLPYRTGITNTHLALRYVRESNEFRQDITKVIVVITDGGSRSPGATAREAQLAREQGFYLFVVGIGQYLDEREWRQIASDPDDSFVYNITNFRFLDTIKYSLPSRACPLPPIILGGFCNVDAQANLMYVAAPGGTDDAVFLVDNFMDRSDDIQNYLRVSYFMEICDNAENRDHGDISAHCDRFRPTSEANSETYSSLLATAQEYARTSRGRRNQVAVLFVDDDSIRLNRFGVELEIERLQRLGVEIIVVDLTPFSSGQNLQSTLANRDNYIRFQTGQSVAAQRSQQRSLIDRTCYAINRRAGVPDIDFNPN